VKKSLSSSLLREEEEKKEKEECIGALRVAGFVCRRLARQRPYFFFFQGRNCFLYFNLARLFKISNSLECA
jgi:hypothetical protein